MCEENSDSEPEHTDYCCELIAVPSPPIFVIKKGPCDPPFYDYSHYVVQPKERTLNFKLKDHEGKDTSDKSKSTSSAVKTKEELIAAARGAYKSRYDNYYNNYNIDWRAKSTVYENEDD